MPRVASIVLPRVAHHVTQRGNNSQDVFFADDDRRTYLDILAKQCRLFGFSANAYCLMTNHVHIVGTPQHEASLAKAIGRTHFRYTQYITQMHGRSGHLWQNRFFSCPLEDTHLMRTRCYVERNPVRAKMVRAPWRYPWSSAAAHVSGEDSTGLLAMRAWNRSWPGQKWKAQLQCKEDAAEVFALRLSTTRGRPLGTDRFLSNLEHRLGRRLRPLPIGRPKKTGKRGNRQNRTAIGEK